MKDFNNYKPWKYSKYFTVEIKWFENWSANLEAQDIFEFVVFACAMGLLITVGDNMLWNTGYGLPMFHF